MQQALELAHAAAASDEVPVGAVLVLNDQIKGLAYNQNRTLHDPTAHAEILALQQAARSIQSQRLPGSTLYVTVEPCAMCTGALVHARIQRLVFGAREPSTGAVVSNFDLLMSDRHNHRVAITEGVLAEACADVMSKFFQNKRAALKQE